MVDDLITGTIYTTVKIHKDHVRRPPCTAVQRRSGERSGVPNDVACFLCRLPRLHGCCTLSSALCTLMGRALASPPPQPTPDLRTMAALFHRPGCQLKETPIREASISGVRLRGHAQVRLLFTSAKPTKTLAAEDGGSSSPPAFSADRRGGSAKVGRVQQIEPTPSVCLSRSDAKRRAVSLNK